MTTAPSVVTSTDATARAGAGTRGTGVGIGLVALLLGAGAWSHRWMSDDGFIYLRVVQNLLAGHGPVFNAGERVESATGPLWTFLLAGADVVTPLRLEWIAVLLGIAAAVTGVVLLMLGSRELWRPGEPTGVLVPLGGLVVATLPAMWDYSTSGLETGLAVAWLGAVFLAVARWAGRPARGRLGVPIGIPLLVGLGPLVRPEFALFLVALTLVLVLPRIARPARLARTKVVALVLAVPGAYEIFRAGYYGALVPNPAFTKESAVARWGQGVHYLADTARPYWLAVPAIAVAVATAVLLRRLFRAPDRRAAGLSVAFLACAAAETLYVVRVGGGHMHARLLLPAIAAAAAPAALVPLRRALVATFAVTLVWALVCAAGLRAPRGDVADGVVNLREVFLAAGPHPITVEAHRAWFERDNGAVTVERTPNGPFVAAFGLPGATAYGLGPDVHVLDEFGLGDWFTARLPLDRSRFPDHQKFIGRWIDARRAIGGWAAATPDDPGARAGIRAFRCGDLGRLHDATTAPLDAGRFVANLATAVRLQEFRVAADPRVAARELCGRSGG